MYFDIGLHAWDWQLSPRLQISSGPIFYQYGPRFGQQLYVDQCFLAREDWHDCPDSLSRAFRNNFERSAVTSRIEIIRLTPVLTAHLREASPADRRLDHDSIKRRPFTDLFAAIASGWRVDGDFYPLGYAVYPPGFKTVTFDARLSRFIGLHIDEIDGLSMDRRDAARMRICINLGQQTRYLLFAPVSVSGMARRLAVCAERLAASPSTPFIRDYLLAHPDQFLVRLAIKPGEAYVAPTENLVHDASTAAMTAIDHSLTLLVHLQDRQTQLQAE